MNFFANIYLFDLIWFDSIYLFFFILFPGDAKRMGNLWTDHILFAISWFCSILVLCLNCFTIRLII